MRKTNASTRIEQIVIVCGDRNWRDRRPVRAVLLPLPSAGRSIVITGGASGADTIGWEIARELGHRNMRLDAPWEAYGNRAGPVRNEWMLDLLLGLRDVYSDDEGKAPVVHVHAFHDHIAASKGTADMLGRARGASVPHTIHTTTSD